MQADEVRTRVAAILTSTAAQLRSLIEECLRAQNYRDTALVASFAEGVAALAERHNSLADETTSIAGDEIKRTPREPIGGMSPAFAEPLRLSQGRAYPKFEREGERLVKIGWSKKDRAVYEHKAPRSAVTAVCTALVATAKSFTMDAILPIKDAVGADVPSYQAYMVVAWLRQLGAVDRMGNDGYIARQEALSKESIDNAWKSLLDR